MADNDPSIKDAVNTARLATKASAGQLPTMAEVESTAKVAGKGIKVQAGCCLGLLIVAIGFVMPLTACIFSESSCDTADALENNSQVSNWAGSTDTVAELGGAKMPATAGKIGHEQHASKQSCFAPGNVHYNGPLSFFDSVGSVSNCMAFGGPMTTEQEEWYFNMRWNTGSGYPSNVKHKKVIITNPVNGKRIVASIEEYGPAARLMTRDGINAGASPEVYKYLGLANPYTGNPNDKSGYATFGFATDQNIPLGPLN